MNHRALTLLTSAALATCAPGACQPAPGPAKPVILVTDLSHPGGDPDDHIDLAVAAGLNMNVEALVLEQADGSGIAPADQMAAIAGTDWPTAVGTDGVDLILDTLAAADQPVTIITIGSLRDIAAAYRRDPDLLHAKTGRLLVFAGDAAELAPVEYNVALDPEAFVDIMGSGLPIRWVPCFDGGLWQAGTRSSFVQTEQRAVLPTTMPDQVERYFTYRLVGSTSDPLAWIKAPVTAADRQLLGDGLRNVWAAGLLDGAVAGGGFEPATVRFNSAGQVDPAGSTVAHVERWHVTDAATFRAAMVSETVAALTVVN